MRAAGQGTMPPDTGAIAAAMPSKASRSLEKHQQQLRESWNKFTSRDILTSLREAVTTADFSIAFGDAFNKRLQKDYRADELNDWRLIVSSIERLPDATNDFKLVRIGTVGVLDTVTENSAYQPFTPQQTEETENLTPLKKGNTLLYTWEDALADRIGVLRRIPRILGRSAARTVQRLVWDEIELNPTIQGNALISSANNNLVTASPVLSYAEVTNAIQLLRDQTEQDSGKKIGLRPKFLLTGTKLADEAWEITDSSVKRNSGEDATVANFVGNAMGVQALTPFHAKPLPP